MFERLWGEDVVSAGPGDTGTGFEICVAANGDVCKTGVFVAPELGGQLGFPMGIAVDAGGNVYVAEQLYNRVSKFDSSGAFERLWGEDVVDTGPGDTPGDGFEICVAANGDVCKAGVDPGPALGGELDLGGAVPGVGVDDMGHVYVADSIHDRVQRFDSAGNFQRAWGQDVVDTGPGDTPADGFEICVAANGDVCKEGTVNNPDLGGELFLPEGLAVDSSGNVYVGDSPSNRVQKFSSAGAFERLWGKDVVSAGPGDTGTGFEICVAANGDTCDDGDLSPAIGGEIDEPEGIGVDPGGNVYVADDQRSRVSKFGSSGGFERLWGKDVVMAGPGDAGTGFEICVAANGDTCKAGTSTDELGGTLDGPQGITADDAGRIYVATGFDRRVQRFDSAGNFELLWGEDVVDTGPGDTAADGFEICVAANGDVCKDGIDPPPALGGELGLLSGSGLAADAAGSIYASDSGHQRVQKFAPDPGPPPAGGAAPAQVASCATVKPGASGFRPREPRTPVVPGVRARLKIDQPSDLEVTARLKVGGETVNLGDHTLRNVTGSRKLRIALPEPEADELDRGTPVILLLKVRSTPRSPSGCPSSTRKLKLKTKIVNVRADLL